MKVLLFLLIASGLGSRVMHLEMIQLDSTEDVSFEAYYDYLLGENAGLKQFSFNELITYGEHNTGLSIMFANEGYYHEYTGAQKTYIDDLGSNKRTQLSIFDGMCASTNDVYDVCEEAEKTQNDDYPVLLENVVQYMMFVDTDDSVLDAVCTLQNITGVLQIHAGKAGPGSAYQFGIVITVKSSADWSRMASDEWFREVTTKIIHTERRKVAAMKGIKCHHFANYGGAHSGFLLISILVASIIGLFVVIFFGVHEANRI